MITPIKRSLILATLTGFLFATFISYTPVNAADCMIPDKVNPQICQDDFYGGNDIIFYDPNAEDCEAPTQMSSGSGSLVGNSNKEKIFTYLVGKGLSTEQAAGIMGNFQQESRLDPAMIQGMKIAGPNYDPVNGVGFGLAQWTFNDRQVPLEVMARDTNRDIIDLGLQLDYFWHEMTGRWAYALTSLKAETTPERAAFVFHRDYEGSNDTEEAVNLVRGGYAREFYEEFKTRLPGQSASENISSGSLECQPDTETGTGLTEYMGANFTIYNQCQYEPYGGSWGTRLTPYGQTMCSAACGPTALAMLAKNMAGTNVTPNETIDFYTQNNYWYPGGGSLISAIGASAGSFGLTASPIPNKDDIVAYKEVFKKGGLISVSSRGTSPFLPMGHTIILRGITDSGNFMIADPGYTNTNIAPGNEFNTDKILTDIRSDSSSVSYAFYKK